MAKEKALSYFQPRSTDLQILAIREDATAEVQLCVVSMVFRGSVCNKENKDGTITRSMKVSKPMCGPVPATATKSLHVRVLEHTRAPSLVICRFLFFHVLFPVGMFGYVWLCRGMSCMSRFFSNVYSLIFFTV